MSEVEINVNEIAGHAAADLVESFFSSVGNVTKDQIAKYKVRFGRGFSSYLSETIARYSKFKTLINRHEAISFEHNYVPVRIKSGEEVFRGEDFFAQLALGKRFIIEGTAGLGKTLFVRHLLRHTILYETDYIPILFELRHLHLDNTKSLIANLVKQVADHLPGFTEEHLRFGMGSGKFIIYLDGIDEIALTDRTRYAAEILDLAYRYPETPVLLSTRPDDFYLPWEAFTVAKLLPMTREQTTLMLSKLNYDGDIKSAFIGTMTEQFFENHEEFLSIPLLATLMMLTYSEFATVPSKMHVFYEQAYQTLFHKHDFIKGAFSRTIESRLDVEQFRQVLAAFCFISYLQERFSFLQFQLIEDLKAAFALSNIDADSDAFLKDLMVTVCLLQRDGIYTTFIHRSFQEYFAALFISNSPPSEVFDIVEALVERGRVDNVLRMVFQLNEGVILQEWVIPKLGKLEGLLNENLSDIALIRSILGKPVYENGLTFPKAGIIEHKSLRIILNEFSDRPNVRTADHQDDRRLITSYIDRQRTLSERQEAYDRRALGAHKREAQGKGFNISALPDNLLNELSCVREVAADIRCIQSLRISLEKKMKERSSGIRNLIARYKH
ncbi:NACHT domain-containing protein [Rhizobium sp. KAs_5_22]|uniref:NACHT domain-containing protein n=1 Tax=Ciceribacter selenitireducens TaxID=448181 RepID=UPI000A00CA44|nr:NACHT domain-containing protein [Ciceribacter selenitireducens]PPJ46397.1 NACHT domain-containing protein [Rhizobium sp. KAs_5_22]